MDSKNKKRGLFYRDKLDFGIDYYQQNTFKNFKFILSLPIQKNKRMLLERIRFMKVNRHKRFHFMPRYYDESRERIENLKKFYNKEKESIPHEKKARLRKELNAAWKSSKSYSKQKKAANLRLIIILVAILFFVYLLFGNLDFFSSQVTHLQTP